MEAKKTPAGAHNKAVIGVWTVRGGDKEPRRGCRPPPEVLVVGFLGTMALLVLSSGGGGSLMSVALPKTELVQRPGKP
jgi:hypothetical protein